MFIGCDSSHMLLAFQSVSKMKVIINSRFWVLFEGGPINQTCDAYRCNSSHMLLAFQSSARRCDFVLFRQVSKMAKKQGLALDFLGSMIIFECLGVQLTEWLRFHLSQFFFSFIFLCFFFIDWILLVLQVSARIDKVYW